MNYALLKLESLITNYQQSVKTISRLSHFAPSVMRVVVSREFRLIRWNCSWSSICKASKSPELFHVLNVTDRLTISVICFPTIFLCSQTSIHGSSTYR